MQAEHRKSKRIMALMPEEEPVFIRADAAQYSAKLVNMGSGGALISILDCDLESELGDVCQLFFSDGDRMFGVTGEVMRKTGRYAAFKFVGVTNDMARNIAYKISRMESLSHRLTMGADILVSLVE
jgi:hypothetical protein